MAQPSSVQREPSMEEILASIRRIIEDNETSRKDEKPASQPVSHKVAEPAPVQEQQPAIKPHEQSVSAAPAVQSEQSVVTPVNIMGEMVSIKPASPAPVPEVVALERPASVTFKAEDSEDAKEDDEAEVELEYADLEPAKEIEAEALSEPVTKVEEPEAPANPAPIVSEQSERKIAMAFGELNEAYQAVRRKSLADAAEDMLRPMLREWIDDNLPQLVERLVREEIERIARGS